MRRSLVRLILGSVLVFWVIAFGVMVLYARSQSWTQERARGEGVFLIHELLDSMPAQRRPQALQDLRQHTVVGLSLISTDEVERRVGRPTRPGDRIRHEATWRDEWYFLVFADGKEALAAGPVNPSVPSGFVPIGVILAIVGLPLIAVLVALRVERRLKKVEQASRALGAGELNARVDAGEASSSELAARFNAWSERIERRIRGRDELIQAVSHELGSPLSRLRFHMELLGTQSGRKREERLHAMTRELDALDELVAELLGYVQSDDLELDQGWFDPQRHLANLTELARLEVPEDRSVEVDLALSDGAQAYADQRLFQRVVENLLRNAVRHASRNVMLDFTEDEEYVEVVVHDDGPGIPDELRERVLAPFVRLGSDRNRKAGGVGLGLAIVRRIMQRHGGRVVIDRSPLGGARVTTRWPCPPRRNQPR